MVIFAVILQFSFVDLKKLAFHIFSPNLHLLSFPGIYSLPCFPLTWRTYEFFPEGHGRTPAKVRSYHKYKLKKKRHMFVLPLGKIMFLPITLPCISDLSKVMGPDLQFLHQFHLVGCQTC